MSHVPEFIPNIPNSAPLTIPKGKPPMNPMDITCGPNSRLPETPGERALREAMAGAPDLRPVDAAAAERAYIANVNWATDHTSVFANAGLSMEIVAGGVRAKCRSCDRAWFIQTGTALEPRVLTCQGGCNRYAADPDYGMGRGFRP
jgi:hypothetical protein